MDVGSTSTRLVFINPEPITKKGIQEQNPQLTRIYTGRQSTELQYTTVAEKTTGCALGAIYEKQHHDPANPKPCRRWIGKVGEPGGLLRNDPNSVRTRTKKELNIDAMREKLASDLFEELGREIFTIPKTRLSQQSILTTYTNGHFMAHHWHGQGIHNTLQIMSRFVENYKDFEKAKTLDEAGHEIKFLEFIERYHRPPDEIIDQHGELVPLRGFMGLLAVGRILADTDLIGGSGKNAGFIFETESGHPIARSVKIDPGYAFQVEQNMPGYNWIINTHKKLGGIMLDNIKDLQIANGNQDVTIKWDSLTHNQKDDFLAALFNCSRYLRSEEVLHFLFYRDGRFRRSDIERMPEEVAQKKMDEMINWMRLQLDIYHDDLTIFRIRCPHQILKAHYVDNWGELPLPMSEETLPIRELFTQLLITENQELELPPEGFLGRMQKEKAIAIEDLFNQKDSATPIHKVLVVGQPAVGKSTLCQKIAHDWASASPSGQCWRNRFEVAVYWIPLRLLNDAVSKGGYLHQVEDPDLFLSLAVSHILLKDPRAREGVLQQIKTSRQHVLVMLDGLDEATEELSLAIAPLFSDPELHILLTSRPGITANLHPQMDRMVENRGFSESQVKTYANQFFIRKENTEGEKNARTFLEAVTCDSNLSHLSCIPLQLQMLCSMWEQGAREHGFGQSVVRLYQNMTEQLFLWQYQRKGKDATAISPGEKEMYFSLLGEIGHQTLSTGQIPQSVVDETCEKRGIAEKALLDTGLLKVTGEGAERQYTFPHLTFQEYLIAHFVSRMPIKEQHDFILENRLKPRYRQTMVFLAGMTHQLDLSDGKAQVSNFFESLYDSSGDVSVKVQLEPILKCLKECPDYKGPVSEKLESLIRGDLSLLDKKLSNRRTPFHFTVEEGNMPGMRWLYRMDPALCSKAANSGITPFHAAALEGRIEAMEWLFDKDPALCSKPDNDGRTPFHAAAWAGNIETMERLYNEDPFLLRKRSEEHTSELQSH